MNLLVGFLAIVIVTLVDFCSSACYRKPQGAIGDRSPVNENYQILIDGNPSTYIPGQQYNFSLACANGLNFISFTLLVEAETQTSPPVSDDQLVGRFEIIDQAETKFSTLCENMIESSNTNTKNRIDVAWLAPSDAQSGCVLFKAAVLQHRNVWFVDDGFLTKRLCPEEIDEINSQTPQVSPCCACDEAKYEIVLERKWMRNTHAKDFPSEAWRTRLGEIIGASHMVNFSFWDYGGRASQGLQELAEHGATSTLEKEIKAFSGSGFIRTIIKAPGIIYRANVLGKTLATVRLGPDHHVISLVAKIDPSPDWILGVAGLELCLANCTWIEKKVLNLYPWDVGTDSGPSYMSPDQAQYPPDVIRRITSTYPSDYRSPFFDESGAPMKPLATLYVNRKRTYERVCNFEETGPFECSTHPWNEWTDCTAKCGAGTQYQMRSYKDPRLAESFNCKVVLRRNRNCIGQQCGIQQSETGTAECELGVWAQWSECSKKCGKGFQTRTRDYMNPYAREKCQEGVAIELQQTRSCNGNNCGGNILTSNYNNNDNNMFNENFEGGAEQTMFDRPNYETPRFDNEFRRKPSKTLEDIKPTDQFDNMDFNYNNNDFKSQISRPMTGNEKGDEFINANNIYGSEKFVGNPQQTYAQEQNEFVGKDRNGNQNLFGGNPRKSYGQEQNEFVGKDRNENQNLFGGNSRQPYGQEQNEFVGKDRNGNQNLFGDLESSYMGNNNMANKPYENQFRPTQKYGSDQNNPAINGNSRYGNLDNNRPTNPYVNKNPYDNGNRDNNLSGFPNAGSENNSFPNYCLQKPEASPLRCNKKRIILKNYWFYDADDGDCKLFTADNCDENKNKFWSLQKCEESCSNSGQILPSNEPDYGNRGGYEQKPPYRTRWN